MSGGVKSIKYDFTIFRNFFFGYYEYHRVMLQLIYCAIGTKTIHNHFVSLYVFQTVRVSADKTRKSSVLNSTLTVQSEHTYINKDQWTNFPKEKQNIYTDLVQLAQGSGNIKPLPGRVPLKSFWAALQPSAADSSYWRNYRKRIRERRGTAD